MALKYTLHVNSVKGQDWLVEIDSPTYSGDPIELIGDENPILIEWNGGVDDDPFKSHIIPQTATFRVYDDNLDVEELQLVDDASFKCRVYLNSQLKHQGYIISDGIQDNDSGVASLVTIKSIDGLELLDAIPFAWGDNYRPITVDGQESAQRCPMNIIRLCLYRSDLLDNILPIRWATSLKSNQYPNDDMLAGRNKLNYDGKLVRYGNKSARWYLEEICRTAQCWLYQRDGYWYIENRGDTIRNGGFMNGWEITTSTSPQVATPISIDLNTRELSGEFINEDAYWMVKKPLGGANVIYEDTTDANNVFPNGGFDTLSLGVIEDWYLSNGVRILSADPINGRTDGYSADIDDSIFPVGDRTVTFGQIPIDTSILFKNATLGFKWLPISGYELTAETGNIDFSKNPLWISVKISTGGQDLYLNEFGYWSDKNVPANAQVTDVYYNNVQRWLYIQFNPSLNFFPGDEVFIGFSRDGIFETYRIAFDVTTPVEDGMDVLVSNIPNSANPIAPAASIYIANVDDYHLNNAYTEKSNDYYKKIQIDGGTELKPNDILDIQFQSKGKSSNIKLPSLLGSLSFEIYSKGGSHMYLDDAYFRVEDNHDKYEIRNTGSKSPIENYNVGISSSYSGHMCSNYMDNYSSSDLSLNWTINGGIGKSLTRIYGEFILDWRNKPRKIFNGSIDEIVQCGDFVTIKGVKYVILNASMQGDGVTRILAFEASLNPTTYNVTHTSTNKEGG